MTKNNKYYPIVSIGQERRCGLAHASGSGSLAGCQSSCQLSTFSELLQTWEFGQDSVLQKHQSYSANLRASGSHCWTETLSANRHISLSTEALTRKQRTAPRVNMLKSEWGMITQMEARVSYDSISEELSYYFRCILVIIRESIHLSHTQEEGISQGIISSKRDY